jgi:hypothetical protein
MKISRAFLPFSIYRQIFLVSATLISCVLFCPSFNSIVYAGDAKFSIDDYDQILLEIKGTKNIFGVYENDVLFEDILTSEDFQDGKLGSDENRDRKLKNLMAPVFEFVQQADSNHYDVPEDLKGKFSDLQHLCIERLLPVTRLLKLRFEQPETTVQFKWGLGLATEQQNFNTNPGIFDAINALDLPYNYGATTGAIRQANLQLVDALAADPSRITEYYNDWIVLYRLAVDLKQFVIGITPKVPIGNTDTDIAMLEKRALYKGMQSFKTMAEGALKDGVYGEVLSLSIIGQVFGGLAAIIEGGTSIHDLFDLMETNFLHALEVGIQLGVDQNGPTETCGYSWVEETLDSVGEIDLKAWIPRDRYNEIVKITGLIDSIEGNLAKIAAYPTVLDRQDVVDWIVVTPGAYLDVEAPEDTLNDLLTFEDHANGPLLRVPENSQVTYRLTFPGLMAQPSFWRSAKTLEIHVNGSFRTGS